MRHIALSNLPAQGRGDWVAVEDGSGSLVFVNHALEQALAYEPGELVGQPWTTLLPGQSDEADDPSVHPEAYLRCKDGAVVPALVAAWRLPIIGDRERRRLSVFVALKDWMHPRAQPDSQEEAAIWDGRLACVVHELNNPLTVITLEAQLLSRIEPTSPSFAEHLSILQDQVKRMKRIVAELRVSAGLDGRQFETADINALIGRTLDMQGFQLQAADVQVTTDLARDLSSILVDPLRLEQVFVNLISNACQALATARPPRVLWISTDLAPGQNGGVAQIQIRFGNNGPAIPRDLLPHVFRPFFTTKEPGRGSGLGLAISVRIVEEHGGRIWVESEEPTGAVFVIELPVDAMVEDKSAPLPVVSHLQPALSPSSRVPATGQHILVVDDEADVVRSVEQLLREAGFRVTSTTETQQALALLDQDQVDLIISDLAMPSIDGSQFYRLVTNRYPHLAQRIIFSSGDSGSQRLSAFLQECQCAWIGKPYQPDELLELIDKILP
jgi:two-component system NtrC family sensor kinase